MLTLIKDIKARFANLASPQRRVVASASASHLSEVPDVEKVEGLKQLTFPHAKHLGARHQEGPDVLQAQKLRWKDKEGSTLAVTSEPFCSDSWRRAAPDLEDNGSKGQMTASLYTKMMHFL